MNQDEAGKVDPLKEVMRLKEVLKDMEDSTDDPGDGQKPPILGLLVLLVLIRRKWGKRL